MIAGAIGRWYEQPVNREFIDRLEAAGVNFGSEQEVQAALAARAAIPQTLEGKAVVVTGAVPGYTREEAEEAIMLRGGIEPRQRQQEDVRARGRRGCRSQQAQQGRAAGHPADRCRALRGAARQRRAPRSDVTQTTVNVQV